ncbi:MAG: hypothetical protein FWD87_02270 [Spirochaetaceae bacterium]|nr:hypothetical protein [Spirochaetaceae bacterium]
MEERQYKHLIFKKYIELCDESDRQKHALQIRDLILRWSKIYFYKDSTYIYWKEITDSVLRVANQEKEKFQNEEEFFKYIKVALLNAKREYYRKEEKKIIHIPKGESKKLKNILDFINRIECDEQRQLSEYEKVRKAAEWFDKPENLIRKYVDRIAVLKNTGSFDESFENEYMRQITPEDRFIKEHNDLEKNKIIHEAVEAAFAKSGKKPTLPLRRALFTAQCLSKETDIDWLYDKFAWIQEYLDNDTLEYYKNHGKPPTNREIYLKLYGDIENPDQIVSPIYNKLIDNFEAALRERIPKIFI